MTDGVGGSIISGVEDYGVTFIKETTSGGQLTREAIVIRESVAVDDQLSSSVLISDTLTVGTVETEELRASSAIAKAAAINASSKDTGITAIVGETRTDFDVRVHETLSKCDMHRHLFS